MGIISQKIESESGAVKTVYLVVAEAINEYTGKRIQKKRRGITSLPKAERIYRELWSACKYEKPNGLSISLWSELKDRYLDSIASKVRSPENPNGYSPVLVKVKHCLLRHTEKWAVTHLDLLTPQFVTDRLDEMEKRGTSRLMTNNILQQIKCTFAFGVAEGIVKANPFVGMKMRKVPKRKKQALTHEEVDILLGEAKRRKHPYYEIWMLTIALGLRRSELAGLKWSDIDFERGLIYLQRQKLPGEGIVGFLKNREDRVVSIPEFLLTFLKQMKLKASSDFVIEVQCKCWEIGHQATVLREFCQKIGIKEVTHHQLRATHITLALVSGVPLGVVKENVGHSKLSTTDVYFRSAGINMRGQMDGLRIRVPQEEEGVILPLKAAR